VKAARPLARHSLGGGGVVGRGGEGPKSGNTVTIRVAAVLSALAEAAWADPAKHQQKPFSHHFLSIFVHFPARASSRTVK
jgi:hypothetical protein